MTFAQSFRPTPVTMITAVAVTAVAAFVLIRARLCALDGSGSCFQLPVAAQILLLFLLWPWAVLVRFGGQGGDIALISIVGFMLSFLWVYALTCLVRWGSLTIRNKRGKKSI